MDERTEQVTQGLTEAMKTESEGYHFYLMAARSTADPKGQEVFQQLAQEELDHLRVLRLQREALQKTGRIDRSVTLGPQHELSHRSPIFSEELRERLEGAHFEMSALSIGLQLELRSEQRYRARSEEAHDPEIQQFFEALADWEARHYEALNRQMEELKEDYWARGGFAPF